MASASPACRVRADIPDSYGPSQRILHQLYSRSLITPDDMQNLPEPVQAQFEQLSTTDDMLSLLVDWRLLTPYQANRIQVGATFGLVLGNYRILDRLGSGAMGVVFRGEDRFSRAPVALKVFPYQGERDRNALDRFLRESKILRQLCNPHIITTLDAGITFPDDANDTRLYYFAMEFIQGSDLQHLISTRGPARLGNVCRWMTQLASALADAHRLGLVHQDVKPANLVVNANGDLKLLDFGIARHPDLSGRGSWGGTIEFMAPEQIQQSEDIDGRADLYGLGAVMYWCLTGRLPFPPTGNLVTDFQQRLQYRPSVRHYAATVPPELDALVQRLLSLYPQDRYATAEQVIAALHRFSV